jgi:hypothetical protein
VANTAASVNFKTLQLGESRIWLMTLRHGSPGLGSRSNSAHASSNAARSAVLSENFLIELPSVWSAGFQAGFRSGFEEIVICFYCARKAG